MAARPMCSAPADGFRCGSIGEDEAVDFVIVGTGAGGGTLACRLAEHGFSVVAFDAGPYLRPLEDFASDESEQTKLYWTDDRIVDGDNPLQMGGNNSGKAVGGSTVHFAMVSLRFRPEWFKSRSLLGYGADWPLDWREMWHYYTEVEDALKIAGPVNYPWGPQPAALSLSRARAQRRRTRPCRRLRGDGHQLDGDAASPRFRRRAAWRIRACIADFAYRAARPMPSRARWSPGFRARSQPAPKSAISRWSAGSKWTTSGLATGVHYYREGQWRFQRARNVVVAGYAIETPRLLLNSATDRFPDGLANSSGLVGKNLMVQSNQAVWGTMDEGSPLLQGAAVARHHRALELRGQGQGFLRRLLLHEPGPAAADVGRHPDRAHAACGDALIREMENYNHVVGLKIVGEMLPQERNRVTLADEKDQYGLPIPRVTYSWCDNDRRLIDHSLAFMTQALEAVGASDIWRQNDDTCHLNGTARMGDDPRTSVVNADCRSWDIRNLWICDGSVFPTVGGVNPSLTIQAIACRTADRIKTMAGRGEL